MAHRGAGMPRPIAHFNAKEFKCHFEHKRHGSIPSWNLKLVNLKFGRDMGRSWDGHGTVMEWSWDCHGTVDVCFFADKKHPHFWTIIHNLSRLKFVVVNVQP